MPAVEADDMKPCPTVQNCPCDSNPVGNFSSEAPDQDVFLGFSTGFIANNPNPGDDWDNSGGFNYCTSPTSQAEADLCADNGSTDNGVNGGGTGGGGGTNDDSGNRGGATLYQSSEQTCSVACPDGNLFSYTLRAGAVTNPNPVLVDRIANSIACIRANQKLICISSISGMACLDESYEQVIQVGSTVPDPVTWHLESGALPPGLEVEFDLFNSRLINISGTPTTAGNYSFTLRADDADGNFMVKAFTISVLAISNTPTAATVGSAYSFQFTATGGTAPYTYSVPPGNLPDGLAMSDSGLITGTPTDTDQTTFTVTIEDATGNQCGKQFTMTPQTGTPQAPGGCKGSFYHYDVAIGDQSLEPWTASVISGSLPPGITLGVINIPGVFAEIFIQGTPTTAGSYTFTIRTTDMNGAHTDYPLRIGVMNFTTNTPPDGVKGSPYSYQLTATGGVGTLVFSGVTLPDGLSVSPTGLISGTPTKWQQVNCVVNVHDSDTPTPSSCSAGFVIVVPFPNQMKISGYSDSMIAANGIVTGVAVWTGHFDVKTGFNTWTINPNTFSLHSSDVPGHRSLMLGVGDFGGESDVAWNGANWLMTVLASSGFNEAQYLGGSDPADPTTGTWNLIFNNGMSTAPATLTVEFY